MSEPELTLGILSRGRPAEVTNALASAIANAANPVRVIALFDEDYESAFIVQDYLKGMPFEVKVLSMRQYYVRGANAFVDMAATDKIVFSNDDVIFFKDWDKIALEALEKAGGGLVELGGEGLKCAHFITTKTFLDEINDGYIGYPGYTFYFSDRELMLRAIGAGGYRWLNPGVITHDVVKDEIRSEVKHWMHQDKAFFKKRAKAFNFFNPKPEDAKDYEIVL